MFVDTARCPSAPGNQSEAALPRRLKGPRGARGGTGHRRPPLRRLRSAARHSGSLRADAELLQCHPAKDMVEVRFRVAPLRQGGAPREARPSSPQAKPLAQRSVCLSCPRLLPTPAQSA
eukprot:4341383-Alexandrium_andersonii.AAC.1